MGFFKQSGCRFRIDPFEICNQIHFEGEAFTLIIITNTNCGGDGRICKRDLLLRGN